MFGLPSDASLHGHEVDGALRYLAIATGTCFFVVLAFLIVVVVRHRQHKRRPLYTHGLDRWNILVAAGAALLVFVVIDLVSLRRSLKHLREGFWAFPDEPALNPFRVEVTAQQWNWTFRYPGADGSFQTADDIVALDELRVPVGRPVLVQLRSKDVVHSFYLPNFRTKVDAIPGHVTRLWFVPRIEGTFEVACSQHCGVGHYRMRGELRVTSAEVWEQWAKRAAKETAARLAALASVLPSPEDEARPEDRPTDPPTAPFAPTITAGLGQADGWPWEPRR